MLLLSSLAQFNHYKLFAFRWIIFYYSDELYHFIVNVKFISRTIGHHRISLDLCMNFYRKCLVVDGWSVDLHRIFGRLVL